MPENIAARNFYDLLRGLVARVPWKDETEQARYHGLLAKLEELDVFGSLAANIKTDSAADDEEVYLLEQRANVRLLRGDLLGGGPRLAERNDHER